MHPDRTLKVAYHDAGLLNLQGTVSVPRTAASHPELRLPDTTREVLMRALFGVKPILATLVTQ